MSLSPSASTATLSACSEKPQTSDSLGIKAEGDAITDADKSDTNEILPVRIPQTPKTTSSLDQDNIEGYMVVHRKQKQRQRFLMSKSTLYVVANVMKHALEIYSNDSRSELLYLLSLADAVLSFESDNANIVMEKCFCVEVQTWKKKSTVRLQPQGFLFFEENQARMLLWVKCIHLSIKRATTLDSELFRCPSTASTVEREADALEAASSETRCTSNAVSPSSSPSSDKVFGVARSKFSQRITIDSAAKIVIAGRTMLTPNRSSSATGERPPSTMNRWSGMFSHDKQHHIRSPSSSSATDVSTPSVEASPKPSPWKRSTKAMTELSSEPGSPSQIVEPISSFWPRVMSPTAKSSHGDTALVTEHVTVNKAEPLSSEDANSTIPDKLTQTDTSAEVLENAEPVALRVLVLMLSVAVFAGSSNGSVFLPLALAGALTHFYNQRQHFSVWTLSSAAVYLASTRNVLFGIGTASILLYIWGYAHFKTQRRHRLLQKSFVHFRDAHSGQARIEVEGCEIPNWVRYPDVDRVEWLNKVFVIGWPYLKKAIEDSVSASVNPALDTQKPAFMNSLSLIRLDLGSKAPHVSGVKFVSADTLTDEVTLDVEVRVLTDKKSFVAELKMVSHLGAAVCLSLRELLLVGTLRITLNPLAKFWPCFCGINMSFTQRPVFDFSLTAAKINIANVPFVSEWLHTFLFDLLIDNFVWPNVLKIPLWDEHGNPIE